MLDLASMTWETEGKPPTLTYELCNNLCDDIESVPYHKVTWPIMLMLPALHEFTLAWLMAHLYSPVQQCVLLVQVFTFGGKRGPMDFQNVVEVMDCGMQFWHTPDIMGQPPCPRSAGTAWWLGACSTAGGMGGHLTELLVCTDALHGPLQPAQ